jgi:ABC-type Fe3+ transport system substrate-binding protein
LSKVQLLIILLAYRFNLVKKRKHFSKQLILEKIYKLNDDNCPFVIKMKRGISTVVVALLVLLILVAAVAAYGWLRPTPTPTTYTPTTLEEKAFQEGGVTIYGVMDTTDFVQYVQPAFYAQYPWAQGKINYVGKSPSDIATSALSEFQANHVTADLLIDTLGAMESALLAGVAENYSNPMIPLMNYSSGTYDPNGLWTIGFGIPIVLIYNTDLVPLDKVPTAWQNLTDSYWHGKIVIDEPRTLNVAAALFAHLYPILGNSSWTTLMQGIAANAGVRTTSAGDSYTDVATGQASIGVGLINDYLSGIHQTPPVHVAIAWIPPITSLPVPAALCAKAPHPNFARLFLNWFASAAGQYTIANSGRVPSSAPIAGFTILAGVLPPGTSIVAAAFNNPDFYVNPTKWGSTFQSIFG